MERKVYYDKNGKLKENVFAEEIRKINADIENGLDVGGLLKVRNRLHQLKSIYERSGSRNLEIEIILKRVNEMIKDSRR